MSEKKKLYYFDDPQVKYMIKVLGTEKSRREMSYFQTCGCGGIFFGTKVLKDRFKEVVSNFALNDKCLIIIGPNVKARNEKRIDKLVKTLRRLKMNVEIWSDVPNEPKAEDVENCAQKAQEFSPGLLIAIGGGSVIDYAKSVWIRYERPDLDVLEVQPLITLNLRKKARFLVIPTTAGTGSESTSGIVLTDASKDPPRKVSVLSQELIPDFVFLDPEWTISMPPNVTADTGMDALAHATDSLLSNWSTPYSEALASKAISLIFKFLPLAFKEPENLDARYYMLIASNLAGLAYSNSGASIDHAFGHAVGMYFNIPHGRACAIFLPSVIQYQSKASDRFLELGRVLGISGNTPNEVLEGIVNEYKKLMKSVEIPLTLKDAGVDESTFKRLSRAIAERAFNDAAAWFDQRESTVDDYEKILEHVFQGKNVDF
ncbi:MAG: iron-containing alcohol dehydrogenase [Candidatus Helarchaeales archaeon]